MNELSLHPVVGLPFVAIVAMVLVGLLFILPRYAELPRWKQATLIALRLLIVALLITAMLRPTFLYIEETPEQASILLLVDSSQSMQVADSLGDSPRWEAARSLLGEASESLAKLAQHWDIKAYTFDDAIHPTPIHEGQINLPAKAEGQQTALGAAMSDAVERESGSRVLSVLLISDGAQRAIAPRDLAPQVAARRLAMENIPLYTFTLGQPGGGDQADLSVDDLVTNETIFAQAPTEITALVRARGFVNKTARLQLLWENAKGEMEVVETKQLRFSLSGAAMPVALTYTPHEPGEHKLTLRLESGDGELITKNNEASTFVTVREGGIQVLFLTGAKRIGGTPGQEQRFVRASLAESPDIVITRRFFNYRQPREDIRELIDRPAFDAVVLDDVDSMALNNESWQALAKRVSEGMGLMMLGGYHSFGPGGYRDAPLGEALPVGIGPAERQNFDEPVRSDMHLKGPVAIRPTQPLGAKHSIPQIHAENQSSPSWSELPPLDGANRLDLTRLKPNAAVLLETESSSPILVAGQYGEGRTLAFAGDSTWRWVMQGFGESHRRFWRQAILWLARKDAQTEGNVWVRLEGRQITRGARVDFQFGHSNVPLPSGERLGEGQSDIQFTATIITPDGTHKTINSSKDGDAFRATFRDTQQPGDYTIEVVARRGDEEVGKAQARFLVPDRDLELEQPAAEPGLMAQLARMTSQAGGKPMAAEELPGLLAQLATQPPEIKKEVLSRITYWDTWPFFLSFVGLLGTEWYLRKQWGLV